MDTLTRAKPKVLRKVSLKGQGTPKGDKNAKLEARHRTEARPDAEHQRKAGQDARRNVGEWPDATYQGEAKRETPRAEEHRKKRPRDKEAEQ